MKNIYQKADASSGQTRVKTASHKTPYYNRVYYNIKEIKLQYKMKKTDNKHKYE